MNQQHVLKQQRKSIPLRRSHYLHALIKIAPYENQLTLNSGNLITSLIIIWAVQSFFFVPRHMRGFLLQHGSYKIMAIINCIYCLIDF